MVLLIKGEIETDPINEGGKCNLFLIVPMPHVIVIISHCMKQKFENQLQIDTSNLLTNPKFTCVTKLIKLNIKE